MKNLCQQETQLLLTNRATRLEVSQGQQTCVTYVFLLLCYSNFVRKMRRFFRNSASKNVVTLKTGLTVG